MPIISQAHSQDDGAPQTDEGVQLVHEGELTLEADAVADFLLHSDFDAFFEHEYAKQHIQLVKETNAETDEEVEFQVLPGEVVAEMLDDTDLTAMFLTFVDETIADEGLESVTRRAAIGALLGEKGPFKRGGFKKLIKKYGKKGHMAVKRMMVAMLKKGVIKRKKKGDGYQRDKGYKTGGVGAKKKAVARFKKKNVAKLKKSQKKVKKVLKTAEGEEPKPEVLTLEGLAELADFGMGFTVETEETDQELLFQFGVKSDLEVPKPGATEEAKAGDVTEDHNLGGDAHRLTALMVEGLSPAPLPTV